MRRLFSLLAFAILLLPCGCGGAKVSPTPTFEPSEVRSPVVAGIFYPDDPEELVATVDDYLAQVERVEGEPIALIVPHAGYLYSGQVAAYAFKQVEGIEYEAVVVVGNNHRDPTFQNISVWAEGAFETPLGLIPVDGELAQALVAANERIVFGKKVHLYEHSIEVELPFLQRVCPDCRMVPVIVGEPSEENIEALSQALIKILTGKKALIIASSDLSHYPHRDDARRVDAATLTAIQSMEPDQLYATTEEMMSRGIPNLATCACGEGPILVAMIAAKGLGANQATILKYANSGDSPLGKESEAVGYGAVMFWRWEPPNFTDEEEAKLLQMARQTLARYLQDTSTPYFEVSEPNLLRRLGAFVTLKQGGELRECSGWVISHQPLYRTVQDSAVSAATEDPRFPPLTLEELEETTIEISVLSPLTRVWNANEIQVGRDGLFIHLGGRSGLLLPQVAAEEGWDTDEFLRAVCRKAGLPEEAWQEGDLNRFTVQVFGEEND